MPRNWLTLRDGYCGDAEYGSINGGASSGNLLRLCRLRCFLKLWACGPAVLEGEVLLRCELLDLRVCILVDLVLALLCQDVCEGDWLISLFGPLWTQICQPTSL